MDDIGRKALLFDVYGPLLTKKQQTVYDLAVGEDMSFGEIAEEVGVSRQAVHDLVRRTGQILADYEEKLGLADQFLAIDGHIKRIRGLLDELPAGAVREKIIAEIDAIDKIERK